MDFVSDGLADGRRLRCLTIVDDCTRECLAIEVDTSITGTRVKAVLERLGRHARTAAIDHGGSWTGVRRPGARCLGLSSQRAACPSSDPGKPNENAYIESFNGKFRDECLNEHWFITMAQAREAIEAWRIEYNTERPHSSPGASDPRGICREACLARDEERVSLSTADSTIRTGLNRVSGHNPNQQAIAEVHDCRRGLRYSELNSSKLP